MKTKTATKEQMDRLTALYGAEAAKISPRRCGVCARPFDDCYCGETAERSPSEPSHPPLTAYQAYRTMRWTSAQDACEECGRVSLSEGSYIEGRLGHYCSGSCRAKAESVPSPDERKSERRQMGLGG